VSNSPRAGSPDATVRFPERIAAVFDIEGTLFTNPMGRGFIEYASSHGRRSQALAYYASILPIYTLSKIGLLPREYINTLAIERMAGLLRGYDLRQAEPFLDWVAERYILPSGRKDVLAAWNRHRGLGHLMLIASGGLAPCVERIGRRLGAEGIAATEVETKNGVYTGRLASPVVIGREKAARTLELILRLGVRVDWGESYTYADSFHDMHLLELAGHPTAVNPDPKLRRAAAERGWKIMD
jgi:HAD superfamily hydrolase (TIGR01490 family)